MRSPVYFLCLFPIAISADTIDPHNFDDYTDYIFPESYEDHFFDLITAPESFIAKLGGRVILPCHTRDAYEDVVLMTRWSHGDTVIRPESNETNMRILNNYDLEVNVTSELEAGNFTCSILYLYGRKSVSHTILIDPEASEEKSTPQYGIAENLSELASAIDTNTSDIVNSNQTKDKNEEAVEKIFRSGFLGAVSATLDDTFRRYISQRNTAKSSAGVTGFCFWTMYSAIGMSLSVYIEDKWSFEKKGSFISVFSNSPMEHQ
ncbi:hypothetical protein JTB14_024454 [Gonioctena quinquepunctata]|nr:hypothetical protein JTB14_024454 [Gonioctena quinquepunctata]